MLAPPASFMDFPDIPISLPDFFLAAFGRHFSSNFMESRKASELSLFNVGSWLAD
jgi:hypothetical protein